MCYVLAEAALQISKQMSQEYGICDLFFPQFLTRHNSAVLFIAVITSAH
jgi:hypothetical protein